jgi:hypothetical protein
MPFDSAVRAIIEGRTFGFCKLVVDETGDAGVREAWRGTERRGRV